MTLTPETNEKTLVIFDISMLYYSSFFSAQNLSYKGFPTGMIYRTIQSVLKVLKDYKADDYVMAMDLPPYKRNTDYAEYKGTRVPAATEFHDQRNQIEAFFRAGTQSIASLRGYEADDMIAVLAEKYYDAYDKIIIFSRDSDMLQLLNDKVSVAFLKGMSMNLEEFREKYEIEPEDWPTVKAIMGDTSDNIPNIPGVAIKSAIKFVAGKASIKLCDKIADCNDQVESNLQLIKLPYPGAECESTFEYSFDEELINELIDNFGFNSYRKQMKSILSRLNCQQ